MFSRILSARRFLTAWIVLSVAAAVPAFPQSMASDRRPSGQIRTEIPYLDGTVVLLSDSQERFERTHYRARGNVMITYKDMVITCDEIDYDHETRHGVTRGPTHFSQGNQWLDCSHAEFDLNTETGTFYDAEGYSDQQFLLRGKIVRKTGPDTYVVEKGFMTACQEKTPKWQFDVSKADIRVDKTARLSNVVFKVKGVPVLYSPFMLLPMEKKTRSSGLLPFHTGNSSTKGRLFSQGWFQTLGPSADLTLFGDYFTQRGYGFGGIFRARPNDQSKIYVQTYGVNDRLGQGGVQFVVDSETRFKNGFRAVASVNATTNFRFRQVFSEGFRSATVPEEHSLLFLTRNDDSFSTNFSFQRDDILLPEGSVVLRKSPSIEFFSLGKPLGNLPLIFSLRAAAEGLARTDSVIETPRIVQRLDFFPSLTLRVPSFAGFSLVPTVGVRETYYSASLTDDPQPEVIPSGLHRRYVDFTLDLRTPVLRRRFDSSSGSFTHLIEPIVTYRRIYGIDHMRETIRFDDEDPIADTNQLEYGLANRVIRSVDAPDGSRQDYEFLSFEIAQKYYFDPTFGGAFVPGQPNVFYPLNTISGFSLTGIERQLSPAHMILRVSPRPGISWDFRSDFDNKFQRMRDLSASTFWQQGKVFAAGTYFKTAALEPGTFDSNHVQGQIGFGDLSHGFSASVTMSYNIRTSQLLNSESRLNYIWNCCGVSLEYQEFDLGLRSERRFTFSFSLKGIGTFGNIKRPESLF